MEPRPSEIMRIWQVVEYLKVTERTIYRLAAAKKILAFKVGGIWRFRATCRGLRTRRLRLSIWAVSGV